MKKILLLATAALTGLSSLAFSSGSNFTQGPKYVQPENSLKAPAFAEGETPFVNFSYADEPYTAYMLNGVSKGNIYLAFRFDKADQTPYVGCKIIGMTITGGTTSAGTNPVTRYVAFVNEELDALPAEKTAYTNSDNTGFGEIYIELDNPVEITGDKHLYPGYMIQYLKNYYYIPVDYVPTQARTCLIANTQKLSEVPAYQNYADEIGSLCLSIRIAGDNLPAFDLKLSDLTLDERYALDDNVDYSVVVKNNGMTPVNSLTISTQVGDNTKETVYDFSSPLASGSKKEITIEGPKAPATPDVVNLLTNIVKANGEDYTSSELSGRVLAYNEGYQRNIVFEEATGNWCQFCPLGILSTEYITEHYPNWICIAVHGGSTTEPMLVPTYNGFINDYISGFPQAVINRSFQFGFSYESPMLDETYAPYNNYYNSFPAYVDIDVNGKLSEDNKSVDIDFGAKFSLTTDKLKHNVSFVIVEDNVGPYKQTNGLGGVPNVGKWTNAGGTVETMYEHVARAISSYPGDGTVIPSSIEKDVTYKTSLNMPLNYSYGYKPDGSRGTNVNAPFKIVALVTDAETGVIVNAKEVTVSSVGVENLSADNNINVFVQNGEIVVEGTDDYAVYSLDGRKVSAKAVSNGVYVVKAAGQTYKVMVK